jgi:NTP pyrophosphatase (non-canonical NTP hydrolase)
VRINHAVVGLAGEVGELAQLLERWVYYGQSLPIPDVEEEVGDCLWYLALLCTAVGIPMERAMEGNIAKLKARFPHKFTEEAATKRDTAAERKASEEATEKAETGFASAYADGLKQLTERYGGVSNKPVSEIYPPPDEKVEKQVEKGKLVDCSESEKLPGRVDLKNPKWHKPTESSKDVINETDEKAKNQDSQPEWASGTVYESPPDWALDYDERIKRLAEQQEASRETTPAPRKPVDLSNPVVVLPGSIPVPGVWACECGQINADCRMFCGWCNKRRKGQEDWLCECSHINLAVDPRCVKCENPRVVESVAPKQSNPISHAVDPAPKGRPKDQPNPFGYDEAGEFEDL